MVLRYGYGIDLPLVILMASIAWANLSAAMAEECAFTVLQKNRKVIFR